MKEEDPLNSVLREWEAPEPSEAVDALIGADYRATIPRSPWRRMWRARICIPVPVLAGLLLLVAAVSWLQFRSGSAVSQPGVAAPSENAYITRIEVAEYQPSPNGTTRIIRAGEVK